MTPSDDGNTIVVPWG